MLRILLFAGANIGVLLVLSLVLRLFGLDQYLDQSGGINYNSLLIMAALIGFGGSLFSLFISKWSAKRAMGVHIIEHPSNSDEQWIVNTVARFAEQKGIGMPEVGIFENPSPNAFATGARRDAALVAVSTGLLQSMNRGEVEAVIGHEIAHVANGDMITMSLLQGVVNTFVIFFSRIIGILIDRMIFKIERGHGPGYWIGSIVAQMVLGILASIIVMWFSRHREFHADIGGAELAGKHNMVGALEALARTSGQPLEDEMAAFGINGGRGLGLKELFMTHPPLRKRIAALQGNL